MQGLKLMSSQLKGKMEARGSNSSHHGKNKETTTKRLATFPGFK